MEEEARDKLMVLLYDPHRDGHESGSESDFPVEERALELIEKMAGELNKLKAACDILYEVHCDDHTELDFVIVMGARPQDRFMDMERYTSAWQAVYDAVRKSRT